MTNYLGTIRYKTLSEWSVTCTRCGELRPAAGCRTYWVYPDELPDGTISACRGIDPLCEACLTAVLEDERAPSAA